MDPELEELKNAIKNFRSSIRDFPVATVSIDDFKPVTEKIEDTRDSLKHLRRLILMRRTKNAVDTEPNDVEEEDLSNILRKLQDTTVLTNFNKIITRLGLHSHATEMIASKAAGTDEMREQIYSDMRTLFALNNEVMELENSVWEATEQQLDMKVECQDALQKYREFLKEQEEIRAKKLEERNPGFVHNKQKLLNSIKKINIMKKLIASFIATSGPLLHTKPLLLKCLEDHRKFVHLETIVKIVESEAANQSRS